LTGLLAAWAGCGSAAPDPTIVPLARWSTEAAAVNCAKTFGCCDYAERLYFGYASEAECRQMIAAEEQAEGIPLLVGLGWVKYNPRAARSCLDELAAAPCAALFARERSVQLIAPSCADVAPGAGKLGTICEDLDLVCESSNCLSTTGTCGPPRGCPATCDVGQYCDEIVDGCTPLKTDGTACRSNLECASPTSVCREMVCGPPLDDGAACGSNTDCVSGVCVLTPSNTAACGPLLGNDAVCVRDEDCASGACVGTAPALTCGAPLPDGSRCSADSACVSGSCQTRELLGNPTCGPPFCDGA